ncbi:hypothetical protein ACWDBT_17205 [Streptomyces ardesiacus]
MRTERSDGDELPIDFAGGRTVDRRRWTVRHEVARAKLLRML